MRKLLIVILLLTIVCIPAFAFLYEIDMLTMDQIKKLTDAQLVVVFTEAKIEERASSEFHVGAGFSSAKEYEKRKELMRFIVNLRKEMSKREIVPDPIEDWLK